MIDILMPRLSDTMTDGAIATWHKKRGDSISAGDVLVEIETDKAVVEHEAYDSGLLVDILVEAGTSVAIGTPIARLDAGTDEAPPATSSESASPASNEVVPTQVEPSESGVSTTPSSSARLFATPLVRRLAKEHGIDLASVTGTGPGGRIVRADINARFSSAATETTAGTSSLSSVSAQSKVDDVREPISMPFDGIRRVVAARLTESAMTIPTFTATASADIGPLMELRTRINAPTVKTGVKVSVNDLLIRAAALALRMHPGVNASYSAEDGGQSLVHSRVHIGLAVASPAGLVVPVVHDADRAAISAIARTTSELVSKAGERQLSTEEMTGGTFTISNLGMYGVEEFTAIINPPQGSILAVGAATPEVRLIDGSPIERRRLRYTITADHRIIDGALAGQFLTALTRLIDDPYQIIV